MLSPGLCYSLRFCAIFGIFCDIYSNSAPLCMHSIDFFYFCAKEEKKLEIFESIWLYKSCVSDMFCSKNSRDLNDLKIQFSVDWHINRLTPVSEQWERTERRHRLWHRWCATALLNIIAIVIAYNITYNLAIKTTFLCRLGFLFNFFTLCFVEHSLPSRVTTELHKRPAIDGEVPRSLR